MNPWFKFYGSEFLSDPKIGSLTAQERSCWLTLLCLSGSSSMPGTVEFLTVEVLLTKSGILFDPYHPEEWEKCLSILKKLENMKMIKAMDNGVIEVLNWNKRQDTNLTNAERQAKYRENHKSNEKVTHTVTKVTLEKNRIEKNREEKNNTSEETSQIVFFIELFKEVNPSYKKFFANKSQRASSKRLVETHGMEKLQKIISFLPKSNQTQYMPVVTTPCQLEDKFAQLATAWQKLKNNEPIIL